MQDMKRNLFLMNQCKFKNNNISWTRTQNNIHNWTIEEEVTRNQKKNQNLKKYWRMKWMGEKWNRFEFKKIYI